MEAAKASRYWTEMRDDFAIFVKPYWDKWYGPDDYMLNKYVYNDEQSIVEYLHNLDERNKALVVLWLLSNSGTGGVDSYISQILCSESD